MTATATPPGARPTATPSDDTGPSRTGDRVKDQRTFRYRAITEEDTVDDGVLTAASEQEAVDRIRRLGYRPISVTPTRGGSLQREYSIPGIGPRVKPAELAGLARQFATMINAGIPLLRTLEVLRRQSDNDLLAQTLDQVTLDIQSGESLSRAIARHPKVFDHLFVSMVQSGEAAGALDVVLLQLANTLERTVAMRQKIRSALAYPAAVMVMVIGVIAAMLILVVPTFGGIYDDLGGTLPLPTRILIQTSDLVTSRLPLVAVALIASVVGFRRWSKTTSGRRRIDRWKLRIPLAGPLVRKAALARFGRTMAVLTRSGVSVLDTLRITAETVGNSLIADALDATGDAVRRGEPIAEQLERVACSRRWWCSSCRSARRPERSTRCSRSSAPRSRRRSRRPSPGSRP